MKLLKLKELNKSLKKYSALVFGALVLFMKKEKSTNMIIYLICSLLGYMLMNKEKENIKIKDFNKFLNENNNQNNNENSFDYFNQDEENEDEYNKYYNNETDNESDNESDNDIENKENIENEKKINKIINKNLKKNNYPTNLNYLNKQYAKKNLKFKLNVNENNKNMPLFNLRSSDKIDFYWNFVLHDFDTKKINNLILCKDINQWMNNSSISDDDLANQCYPFYIIIRDRKTNDEIMIFEVYKIFVYTDENSKKQAFIIKGDNYKTSEEIINILIELKYIKDLLNGQDYESYNLSAHETVTSFLDNLLSHFLPYDSKNNETIHIDLKELNENKNTFEYFYHTNMLDNEMFNTNI